MDRRGGHFGVRQAEEKAGFRQPRMRPQARLHDNGIFELRKDDPEVAEQVEFTDNPDCGLHHCALKKQNPTRAISRRIMKILRIEPKNSEKKGLFFWAGEPDKLLKTKDIRNFLRKTNPSEPEKSLKTNNIKNFLRSPKRTRAGPAAHLRSSRVPGA